jgi:hypothetical protein
VDEIFYQEISTRGPGWFGVRDRAVSSHPIVAFPLDARSAFMEDGSCYSGPMLKILIGGIDDGIRHLGGDIALDKLDGLAGGENGFVRDGVHKDILQLKMMGRQFNCRPI